MKIGGKKETKTLRHIHKDIAHEIKRRPYLVPDDIFYLFTKNNPYRLKNPERAKIINNISTTPKKHSREQKEFFRSFSPSKRISYFETVSKTPVNKYPKIQLTDNIFNNRSESSTPTPFTDDYYENSLMPLYEHKENSKNTEYRKQYNRIFRGKISKKYLTYNT